MTHSSGPWAHKPRKDSWKVKALGHLSLGVTVFAMFMLAAFVLSLILQGVDAI
jgi:hypothetical protein